MGLEKHFGDLKVFYDLSFRVDEKSGLFVTGRSGCGKTTLLRIIAGLDPDYTGDVIIDGKRMDASVRAQDRNVAIVFQESTLWNHMTVEKNMSYGMKKKDMEKIEFVAEGLQIRELLKKYPEEISGGQAKRVALARALLSGKTNLLLDEPLSNVDRSTKDLIIDFLKKQYSDSRCIIYVTHDKEELSAFAFDVLEMEHEANS